MHSEVPSRSAAEGSTALNCLGALSPGASCAGGRAQGANGASSTSIGSVRGRVCSFG